MLEVNTRILGFDMSHRESCISYQGYVESEIREIREMGSIVLHIAFLVTY